MERLLEYLDNKNSHGRVQLSTYLEGLGLSQSTFYIKVSTGPTSIGKNQAKFLLLDSFIERLKG
jgi:hypothetical protein